jgi:hypothetical protein
MTFTRRVRIEQSDIHKLVVCTFQFGYATNSETIWIVGLVK